MAINLNHFSRLKGDLFENIKPEEDARHLYEQRSHFMAHALYKEGVRREPDQEHFPSRLFICRDGARRSSGRAPDQRRFGGMLCPPQDVRRNCPLNFKQGET